MMDRNNDALSADALVVHAALAGEDGEVCLERLHDSELVALWAALETVRNAVAEESSRRLRIRSLKER